MAWRKGESGNPSGRKKGGVNFKALRDSIDVPEILEALKTAARGGDVQAAKILLSKALPDLRPVDVPVKLPVANGASPAEAAASILAATTTGTLTPEQGAKMLAAMAQFARVLEVDELTRRIEALEAQQ